MKFRYTTVPGLLQHCLKFQAMWYYGPSDKISFMPLTNKNHRTVA